MLGLLYFCNLSPFLFFAPYAGLIADRYSRQRIVVVSRASTGALALGLVGTLTLLEPESHLAPA